jgi:hypothetical protein
MLRIPFRRLPISRNLYALTDCFDHAATLTGMGFSAAAILRTIAFPFSVNRLV